MTKTITLEEYSIDNHIDDHVEKEIQDCFSTEDPKCFFVFAGAGSGKTRSLINTLTFLDKERGKSLLEGKNKLPLLLTQMRLVTKYPGDCSINRFFLYLRYIAFCGI